MSTIKLSKSDEKFIKDQGITDVMLFLRDLVKVEEFISENYPQATDEAWMSIANEEEEEDDD